MSREELENICKEVRKCAAKAADFIKAESKSFRQEAVEYKGSNDLVSYVDKTSEKMIIDYLQNVLPEAGFIAEENTIASSTKTLNWIIDPLDGTTNFVHGVPCYCVSIALAEGGDVLVGVVHEVNLNESFYAWKNGGAWLNGNPIRVSECPELSQSLLATGFPYHDYDRLEEYMKVFDELMHGTHGLRRLGSAAADMAYVAAGRFEGFYEYGLNSWDVAAGIILVQEAGGKVSDFSGGNDHLFGKEIISANSKMFDELAAVIYRYFSSSVSS